MTRAYTYFKCHAFLGNVQMNPIAVFACHAKGEDREVAMGAVSPQLDGELSGLD